MGDRNIGDISDNRDAKSNDTSIAEVTIRFWNCDAVNIAAINGENKVSDVWPGGLSI